MVELIIVFCYVAALFLLLRGFIVYRVSIRRINEIHEVHMRRLKNGEFSMGSSMKNYDKFHKRSFERKLFDVHCWTYRQFYPEDVE